MREKVMAIDKDPSIFTDRSTIGSSDELDEYGVWVKSEPKDVSDTMNSNETAGMDSLLEDSFEPSLRTLKTCQIWKWIPFPNWSLIRKRNPNRYRKWAIFPNLKIFP
jgi:hypothetical protein